MKLYEYTPKNNYSKIGGLVMILVAVAAGLFAIPAFFPHIPVQWLFHSGGILSLGAAIFIVCRYIMKKFVYAIEDSSSGHELSLDFTVTEITNKGKSQVTVCRFALSSIKEIETFYPEKKSSKDEMKAFVAKARRGGKPMFDYRPDMLSSPVTVISATEGGQDFVIKLSPDDTILEYLQAKAK